MRQFKGTAPTNSQQNVGKSPPDIWLNHTSGIRHYGGPRNEAELLSNKHYLSVVEDLDICNRTTHCFLSTVFVRHTVHMARTYSGVYWKARRARCSLTIFRPTSLLPRE